MIFHGDGRDLGRDHMRQVFETTMVAELKPMLPEPLREAFTVADSLVDVTSARSDQEAVARLAGACTQIVVTAMFHAAGLGAVAPLVGAIDGMLSAPEPSRALDSPSDEHTMHRTLDAEIVEPPEIPEPRRRPMPGANNARTCPGEIHSTRQNWKDPEKGDKAEIAC